MTIYDKVTKEFEDYKKELDEMGKTMSPSELIDRVCYKYFIYNEIVEQISLLEYEYELKNPQDTVLQSIYIDYMEYEVGGYDSLMSSINDYINNYCEVEE